jgi:CDP-glycerol glycerophosphotransferase
MAYLVSKNDSDMIDYVVIDSEWCREMYPKGMLYQGEYLMSGSPRSDAMFTDRTEKKNQLINRFHLNGQVNFVMYAPTFREQSNQGKRTVSAEEGSLDYALLLQSLEQRFGGEWYVCLRVHPQLAEQMKGKPTRQDKVLDVSVDDDMYDLLPAMDALVTDYSTVAMDASFGDIPVFLYADDLEKYIHDRGSFLWNVAERADGKVKNNKTMTPGLDVTLPYTIAETNEELKENILCFDEAKYKESMECFKRDVGLVFDGRASQKVAEVVFNFL